MSVGHNTGTTQADREALGANLRARRERLGMTQRDLSAITGISQNSISRIEQALSDPLVSSVFTVAGAVGRRVELAAEHHLPLLGLTAAEIDTIRDIVALFAGRVDAIDTEDAIVAAALAKLTTSTEETQP